MFVSGNVTYFQDAFIVSHKLQAKHIDLENSFLLNKTNCCFQNQEIPKKKGNRIFTLTDWAL